MPTPIPAERRLPVLLRQQAGLHPDRPALLSADGATISHGALWRRLETLAAALRAAGVGPATRVAVSLPEGPATAVVLLALMSCAVCVPLSPRLRPEERRFALADFGVRAVVTDREADWDGDAGGAGVPLLRPDDRGDGFVGAGLRVPDNGDAAAAPVPAVLLLHTSGTTARPKIVPLADANLAASALNIARCLALQPADRCLGVMPLFHVHGLVGCLLASLVSGGSMVCTPGYDEARFFDWVARHDPSWYSAVPTIHQSVLAAGVRYRERAPAHRFRFVRSSSAALSPASAAALEALTGAPVIEAYGMTEAAHQMASNPLPPGERRAGTVGRPDGAEIVLLDADGQPLPPGATGEIAVRGPGVMAAYEADAAVNAAAFVDGWLRTGDLGRFDADGHLSIAGRIKEIVNRGGEKVSPREIDDALLAHPEVAQAAAFAVPHASLGEDLAAAVVLRPAARVDEAALRDFLFARLAPHKVPSALVFVEAIPTAATGKVQRTRLHALLGAGLAREAVAPRDATEALVEQAWREVLGGGPYGVHDNFFGLGGDSLQGARTVAAINLRLDIQLPATALFRCPTIAGLAGEAAAARAAWGRLADGIAAEIDGLDDDEVRRLLDAAAPPRHA